MCFSAESLGLTTSLYTEAQLSGKLPDLCGFSPILTVKTHTLAEPNVDTGNKQPTTTQYNSEREAQGSADGEKIIKEKLTP